MSTVKSMVSGATITLTANSPQKGLMLAVRSQALGSTGLQTVRPILLAQPNNSFKADGFAAA